jgi:transposase
MRLRAKLSSEQTRKVSAWIYATHAFRNAAVAFLNARRGARASWVARHPALARGWIPEEWAGSDTNACSKWLTVQLEKIRNALALELGLSPGLGKSSLAAAETAAWSRLSRGERDNLRSALLEQGLDPLWVLLPRTVLDQTIQDLAKTTAKAIADRAENKRRKAAGLKPLRAAGFPQFQKFSYPNSIRFQLVAEKQKEFREAWERKELLIPALGRLKIRESGYAWPATPPKLVTLARSADGSWHVSFVCAPGQARCARQRRLDKLGVTWEPLPKDAETGLPAIEGLDMSLAEKAVSNMHGNLGRIRYLKRCASLLRFRNKNVSRGQPGSRRNHKAKRKLGALHVRIANHRQHENRAAAQAIASRSAIVCVETLKLGFMQKNSRLAQSIADLGWGQFLKELDQQMAARGHLLLYAGQFDPTTQTCPGCGVVNKALKGIKALKIRQWDCTHCHAHHNRDLAAADNIQDFAVQRFLESFTGAESVPGNRPLHPELAAFISRGGMTAFQRGNSRERRQVKSLGLEVPVNRGSTPTPSDPVRNRS